MFISFSDDTAIYETVIFPEPYADHQDLILLGGAFAIQGIVDEELGAIQVDIQKLNRITGAPIKSSELKLQH